MKTTLNATEARVIGALIEKAITTPEQYPLSLQALVQACNQKSNRDPVLNLEVGAVQQTVDGLKRRLLVSEGGGYGSRVAKYQHRFCNSAFGGLQLDPEELAIVCELLLRGPQTPGELRSHGERLQPFSGIEAVEAALQRLMALEEPLVEQLPREPGKREARYRHVLGEAVEDGLDGGGGAAGPNLSTAERLDRLEQAVEALRAAVDQLR
jgi:uncharacterized protein